MRLIDADVLKERWTIASPEPYNTDAAEVLDSIDETPTAYDIDKVVEQLEGLKDTEQDDSVAEFISTRIWNKAISKAIAIVKGGAE